MLLDHSDVDRTSLLADASAAISAFHDHVYLGVGPVGFERIF